MKTLDHVWLFNLDRQMPPWACMLLYALQLKRLTCLWHYWKIIYVAHIVTAIQKLFVKCGRNPHHAFFMWLIVSYFPCAKDLFLFRDRNAYVTSVNSWWMAVPQTVKISMSVIPQAYVHRYVPTQRGHTFVLVMMDTSWIQIREPAKLPVSSVIYYITCFAFFQ